MTLTNPVDVQILVKSGIDPNDLTEACALADKQIIALTGFAIEEIDPSFKSYGALQGIGAEYAAWVILSGWDDMYFKKAEMMWNAYQESVKNFKEMPIPKELEDPAITITESEYTIPALNPNLSHYMSTY
jgi:hypothetical protein